MNNFSKWYSTLNWDSIVHSWDSLQGYQKWSQNSEKYTLSKRTAYIQVLKKSFVMFYKIHHLYLQPSLGS